MARQTRQDSKYQNYKNQRGDPETKSNPPPKTTDDYIQPAKKPVATAPLLSTEEIELRQLRTRFKKIYGYKPVGLLLDDLRYKVETEERLRGWDVQNV